MSSFALGTSRRSNDKRSCLPFTSQTAAGALAGHLQSLTAAVILIASRKPGASVLSVLQSGQRISDMGRDSQRHPASAVTCFKILHAISGSEQHLGRGLTLLWTRNAWLQGSLIAISEEWPYRAFALALWEAMWHGATTFSSSGTLN